MPIGPPADQRHLPPAPPPCPAPGFVPAYCARGCGRIVAAEGRSCPPVDPKAVKLACWPIPRGEGEVRAEMERLKAQAKTDPSVFEAEISANMKEWMKEHVDPALLARARSRASALRGGR